MGAKLPYSIKIPVRESSGIDGPGAWYRVQGHLDPVDPKSRIHSKDRANRRGDADPAICSVRRPGRVEPESARGPVLSHMLFLDSTYTENKYGKIRLQQTTATSQQLLNIVMILGVVEIGDDFALPVDRCLLHRFRSDVVTGGKMGAIGVKNNNLNFFIGDRFTSCIVQLQN